MATHIERGTTIVEALTDRLSTPAELIRVRDAFVKMHNTGGFRGRRLYIDFTTRDPAWDFANLSDDQKAERVLDYFKAFGQAVLRHSAETTELENQQANISNAGDTAVNDLS